jgi:conjugal transfer pilus assembly protein TraB
LGSGLAQGAHELQKFYLEIAKQSMPVIEVAATRNITLVVSEGVDLEIKEKPGGKKQK